MERSLIFKDFTTEEIRDFLENSASFRKEFKAGELIFCIGERPKYLFVLLEGSIHIENVMPSGRKVLVNRFFSPGTVFGEVYLYLVNQPYDYQCMAAENTAVLAIPKEWILEERDPVLGKKIKNNMLVILSTKAYTLNKRLLVFSEGSIREKILQDLKQRAGHGDTFTFYATRDEWAALLGIPRPSLSRELAKLQEEGILTTDRGKVKVDLKRLRKL